MKTTIHQYRFDLSKPDEAKDWDVLKARLHAQGLQCFESLGQTSHYQPKLDGVVVELETAFVFNNQWNTAPIPGITDSGLRVFDWALDALFSASYLKRGHYLDYTDEMRETRENRLVCGYCGKQYDKRDTPEPPKFCRACLGSEYLKEADLKLTRVSPVLAKDAERFAELTPEELAEMLPIYRAEQQGKGSERSRIAREHYGARLEQAYSERMEKIKIDYEGRKWLFDRGANLRILNNCIYYDHRKMFTFGWNPKMEAGADLDWLLANLSEFPYEYEIVTAHRGILSGRE